MRVNGNSGEICLIALYSYNGRADWARALPDRRLVTKLGVVIQGFVWERVRAIRILDYLRVEVLWQLMHTAWLVVMHWCELVDTQTVAIQYSESRCQRPLGVWAIRPSSRGVQYTKLSFDITRRFNKVFTYPKHFIVVPIIGYSGSRIPTPVPSGY
jgi:hypothetical protein